MGIPIKDNSHSWSTLPSEGIGSTARLEH
jgi:hypothetical protein